MKLDKNSLALYAVTDPGWTGTLSLAEQVHAALRGGATFIQLREKEREKEIFFPEAKQIQELCKDYGVPFVVNDDVALAKELGADGVHVGQSDMGTLEARAILGEAAIVGVSAQTVEQAKKAEQDGADYLGVGAVFPTSTKEDAAEVSFDTLKAICEAVQIPVIAIGGIGVHNMTSLAGSGIVGVAVISAIFGKKNIEQETAVLKNIVEEVILG